jgi:AcrR family transcriptional regulator
MIARPPASEAPPRRRLSASARRATILRVAIACFGARGFDATAMDDIAAAAGISKPVLYDHFASKDVLYLALLESLRDRLLAAGAASFATATSIEAGVARAIGDFVAFVAAEPDAARLLFQSPAGEGPRVDAARRIQAEASAALAATLDTRTSAVQSTEHAIAIEFIKAGLHAVALWWADHPQITPEQLTAMLATLSWSGLSGLLDLD